MRRRRAAWRAAAAAAAAAAAVVAAVVALAVEATCADAGLLGSMKWRTGHIAQELCESRGGRPGLAVLNEPSGFRGRKAILNRASALVTACPEYVN